MSDSISFPLSHHRKLSLKSPRLSFSMKHMQTCIRARKVVMEAKKSEERLEVSVWRNFVIGKLQFKRITMSKGNRNPGLARLICMTAELPNVHSSR